MWTELNCLYGSFKHARPASKQTVFVKIVKNINIYRIYIEYKYSAALNKIQVNFLIK